MTEYLSEETSDPSFPLVSLCNSSNQWDFPDRIVRFHRSYFQQKIFTFRLKVIQNGNRIAAPDLRKKRQTALCEELIKPKYRVDGFKTATLQKTKDNNQTKECQGGTFFGDFSVSLPTSPPGPLSNIGEGENCLVGLRGIWGLLFG